MFGLTTATRVFVAPGATDMRKGLDGLFGLVRDALGEDPLSGHLFLFANRDRAYSDEADNDSDLMPIVIPG